MDGDDNITCEIDLHAGTIKIQAPPQHFAAAAKEAREIMNLRQTDRPDDKANSQSTGGAARQTTGGISAKATIDRNRSSGRQVGGSAGRPGRIGSFMPVEFELTEANERELREFYLGKAPKSQAEQVAVALYVAQKVLGRSGYSYNEIYSLLRLCGERDLPRALDVLIASMKKDLWVTVEQDGYALKYLARDHVEQKLPAPAGSKS